ncbi:tyrosine-protein phosphatase [Bacillus alkalicellulosilyticus]|uniref:tyrosine-protein phosphatase n=1 Tax=Alkalihalobacterium alkalicellulosilyticum TaxID=1912214 RepID=UPI00099636CC|nr:CpsB/CapC family capsule biosynthesis tyrosine phosphatase [Bacillus alkalicellulosilyticus]
MIDIHCHILPGLDDGPKNENQSIEMAKAAVTEGITSIIATPHHRHPSFSNEGCTIKDTTELFNQRLKQENIELTILPGQEVRMVGDIAQGLETKELLTLADGNKYLFLELPSSHVPRYAANIIYQTQLSGITPIIVHPERNKELIEKPEVIYDFVKNGALTQLTASSITGHFGKNIKKFSEQIIESNLTHFIASDAHNIESRPFRLQESYMLIEKVFGTGTVYQFQENAQLLLEHQHIAMVQPEPIKRRKFLGIF